MTADDIILCPPLPPESTVHFALDFLFLSLKRTDKCQDYCNNEVRITVLAPRLEIPHLYKHKESRVAGDDTKHKIGFETHRDELRVT